MKQLYSSLSMFIQRYMNYVYQLHMSTSSYPMRRDWSMQRELLNNNTALILPKGGKGTGKKYFGKVRSFHILKW